MTKAERHARYKTELAYTNFVFDGATYDKTGRQRVCMTVPIINEYDHGEFFKVAVYSVSRTSDSAYDIVMRITYHKATVNNTEDFEVSRRTVLKENVGRVTIKALCDAAKMVSLNTVADVLKKSSDEYYNIFKARYGFACNL